MIEKEIHIGTKQLALVVNYCKICVEFPMQDGDEYLPIYRKDIGLSTEAPFNPKGFGHLWGDEEIDIASQQAAKELLDRKIIPSKIESFVDDRYGRLTQEQMRRFRQYCEQELKERK